MVSASCNAATAARASQVGGRRTLNFRRVNGRSPLPARPKSGNPSAAMTLSVGFHVRARSCSTQSEVIGSVVPDHLYCALIGSGNSAAVGRISGSAESVRVVDGLGKQGLEWHVVQSLCVCRYERDLGSHPCVVSLFPPQRAEAPPVTLLQTRELVLRHWR